MVSPEAFRPQRPMFMFVSEMKINKKIVVFMIKYIWVYWRGKWIESCGYYVFCAEKRIRKKINRESCKLSGKVKRKYAQ
jgi:hypothetical protein